MRRLAGAVLGATCAFGVLGCGGGDDDGGAGIDAGGGGADGGGATFALAWAKSAGGRSRGIGVAPDGTATVVGYIFGSATFGALEPAETTLTAVGGMDLFVARYNPDGTLAWAKSAGGGEDETARCAAVMGDGMTIVAGAFASSTTLGAGESGETVLEPAATQRAGSFVAKYEADGTLVWAKQAVGTGLVAGLACAASPDGAVVVAGFFDGTATFGAGEAGEAMLSTETGGNGFVAKYDAGGDLVWARQVLGRVETVSVAPDGAVFVAGQSGNGYDSDAHVARYDSDGTLSWAIIEGGDDGADSAQAVVGFDDGTAIVAGYFSGSGSVGDTKTFGAGSDNETTVTVAGSRDLYVAGYGADGTLSWLKAVGSAGDEVATSMSRTSGGRVVVAGFFERESGDGNVTFGVGEPGEASFDLAADFGRAFVAEYGRDGALQWVSPVAVGGQDDDSLYMYRVLVAALGDAAVLVSGEFAGTLTFGAGEANETATVASNLTDFFLARFAR